MFCHIKKTTAIHQRPNDEDYWLSFGLQQWLQHIPYIWEEKNNDFIHTNTINKTVLVDSYQQQALHYRLLDLDRHIQIGAKKLVLIVNVLVESFQTFCFYSFIAFRNFLYVSGSKIFWPEAWLRKHAFLFQMRTWCVKILKNMLLSLFYWSITVWQWNAINVFADPPLRIDD